MFGHKNIRNARSRMRCTFPYCRSSTEITQRKSLMLEYFYNLQLSQFHGAYDIIHRQQNVTVTRLALTLRNHKRTGFDYRSKCRLSFTRFVPFRRWADLLTQRLDQELDNRQIGIRVPSDIKKLLFSTAFKTRHRSPLSLLPN